MDICAINAQTVYRVNAYCDNEVLQNLPVGKTAKTEPCEFWKRLIDAWGSHDLPTSQNGVATTLDMSQGSTRRWYTGDGLPETATIIDIARRGKVTVDWLLTGRMPRVPVKVGSPLERVLVIWEALDEDARTHLCRAAEGQLAVALKGGPTAPDRGKSARQKAA